MKKYNGFAEINTTTYNKWRSAVIGNAYNYDGKWGYQCYDLANEFWKNTTGHTCSSATKDGGIEGGASGIWGARVKNNYDDKFSFITDYTKLKKGDIVVTNNGKFGHICWLDQDYTNDTYLKVLGQNQSGTGGNLPGAKVNVINWAFRKYFLGAFRYKKWHKSPSVGIYKCLYDMNIRKSPNGARVKVKDCTNAMKKALISQKPNDYAVIKKRTNITILEVKEINGVYWGRNYSGYVCLQDNNVYCKKV